MGRNRRLSTVSAQTPAKWAEREGRIARIAAAQHDQITAAQLLAAGLSPGGIAHRARTGRLHRVRRGIYSIGRSPTSAYEHWMSAVLACGDGAAVSHAAAADNLGIRRSAATVIDVTSPTDAGRGHDGIRIHRSKLAPEEVTLVNDIPTTTCARTLLDLAEILHPEALARALDEAEILRIFDLTDLTDLERVIERNPGRHGLHPLHALLSSLDPQSKRTRNDFERRLYRLCEQAGLPKPQPNEWLHPEATWIQVDFLWGDARLVLETDGWETHGTRQAFERDRRRDQLLLRARYRTVRVTWRQLRDEPALVIATIRAALS